MKDKKPLNYRIFRAVFIVLILFFCGIYFSVEAGYYDSVERKKVVFTSEQIEQFEKDVNEGKNVLIEDYLEKQNNDYSNNASTMGNKVSQKIGKITKSGIEGFFKLVEKLVTD